ncbi:MAG: hypothetical protein ABJQ70_11190 [Roseobacter sp.]
MRKQPFRRKLQTAALSAKQTSGLASASDRNADEAAVDTYDLNGRYPFLSPAGNEQRRE